ncbi:MAG TPA: ABC transporter ATP-binding protein [Micromonosporaceae bacterium]
MLEVSGLVAGYGGVPVLHGIDLSVPDGSIIAILGANGAGKTTLLRTLSGLIRPSAGQVMFKDRDLTSGRPVSVEERARRGMALVPETGGVIAELTVDENLRLGGLWRTDRADAAAAITEVYDRFPPLAQRRSALGQQLSGGERQMLAIGRALVARPTLLLLDEPSLGLAPRITTQIMELLRDLREQQQLTVLLVEQNVRAALSIADEGIVIALGRVVARSSADEMRGDDAMRHAYLGF